MSSPSPSNNIWVAYSVRRDLGDAGLLRSRGRRGAGEFFGGGVGPIGAVGRGRSIDGFPPISGRSRGDDAPAVDAPGTLGRRNASVSGWRRQTANLTTRPRRAIGTPPGLAASAAIGRGGFPLSRCARGPHALGVRQRRITEILRSVSWQSIGGCGSVATSTMTNRVGGAGSEARLFAVAGPCAGDTEMGRGVGWHEGSDEVGTTVVWGRGIRVN